jgi:hypothetical protein
MERDYMDKSKNEGHVEPKLRVKSRVKAGTTITPGLTDPPALSSGAVGLRGGLSACKNNTQRTSGF